METDRVTEGQHRRRSRTRGKSRTTAAKLEKSTVASFRDQLRGELLRPGDPGYEDARQIWNAMIDRRPSMIARCTGSADVIRSIRFAREQDIPFSVRGVGHNIAGNSVCDGGLMIDLSSMNWVHVDSDYRRAWAGPGATLGDLDHETQAYGLAVPVGINSTTGIAGAPTCCLRGSTIFLHVSFFCLRGPQLLNEARSNLLMILERGVRRSFVRG